jgi:hypothetical protein
MKQTPQFNAQALWNRFVESHKAFYKTQMDLFKQRTQLLENAENLVRLVRDGLRIPTERDAAIEIAKFLSKEQLKELLPSLVSLASFSHGLTGEARDLILSLPRDWTTANIENIAEPILQNGAYEEYQRILELYSLLDPGLARRCANRALGHNDPEVAEVGRDFLDRLGDK